MDLERLKQFIAIVEEGSLTGAAKRLEVTQPAVSRNLKLLEEELGVALFERVGRGLEITPAGRALLLRARDLLRHVEALTAQVRQADTEGASSLRVAFSPPLFECVAPACLSSLVTRLGDLSLSFVELPTTDALLDALAAGEADVALFLDDSPPRMAQEAPGEAPLISRVGPLPQALYEAPTRPGAPRPSTSLVFSSSRERRRARSRPPGVRQSHPALVCVERQRARLALSRDRRTRRRRRWGAPAGHRHRHARPRAPR